MSSNMTFGQFGGANPIDITSDLFTDLIRTIGVPLDLYRRGQMIDCSCISETYKTADRKCSTCQGTGSIGGYTLEPAFAFLGVIQIKDRKGRMDIQRLYSKMGPVDTLDAVLYTEDRWYERLNLEDLIVWFPKGELEGYEFRIVAKDPQIIGNELIYGRFELVRNAYPMRPNAIDLRKRA